MPRLIKVAIVCGAVPLLAGTLIYVTWLFTRWDPLMAAGFVTICAGLVAFLIGSLCLLLEFFDFAADPAERRQFRRHRFFALGLLLINFPAAMFYMLSAIHVRALYTVQVHNDSDRPIESLVVTGPGLRAELGPIPAGGRAHRNWRFESEGTLDFTARQQEVQFSGELDPYVTNSWGGERTIRVTQKGIYQVEPADDLDPG